jgi:hypothetical protein
VALVGSGLLQAAGFALWTLAPGVPGFGAGFVMWGLGGALASGAFEALVHDGLAAAGAEDRYAWVMGRAAAAGLAVQVPSALAATAFVAAGGYALAGWASVVTCLAGSALAAGLPEPRRTAGDDEEGRGYVAILRAGVAEAADSAGVRGALVACAAIASFDALEEYFGLLVASWGVPPEFVPTALLVVSAAAAAAVLAAPRAGRLGAPGMGALLGAGAAGLTAAVALGGIGGLAGLAAFHGLWRLAAVVADARLQSRVAGPARATVTSLAGLAADLAGFALYAAWATGGAGTAAVLAALTALAVPALLRGRAP